MSFSPTTSGTEPARIAVASWLVSSFGGVRCRTTLRFLCVALNWAVSAFAGPSVACRAQKCTVPFAPTPNGLDDGAAPDEPPQAASASAAATAMTASDLARAPLVIIRRCCPPLESRAAAARG